MEFKKGRVSLSPLGMEKKWAFPLFIISFFAAFLVTSLNMGLLSSVSTIDSFLSFLPSKFSGDRSAIVVESKLSPAPPAMATNVPRLAYLISGSKGNLNQLWRTLHALYHPHNLYVVHLDLESSVAERRELVARVANHSLFAKVENVHVIKKANMVTYRGPTMMANTLHACAILLKKKKHWDWFINLSASDYPLVTQDGSAWMALSRDFVEFCIYGWDNLPRTLLMYYTNFISSSEGYFQTVICNIPEFNNTVANHDLHYISWDNPPKQHPHILALPDLERMISSKAPFARKFEMNDSVLHKIDEEFLGRKGEESIVPGGWCSGEPQCSDIGDEMRLEPGPGSQRLTQLMDRLVRSNNFKLNQCR
ncbi:hypothetical protein IEQ34_002625 [Dendrobium chrysotoxum]|uniref:Uncharacterized protein n=1 Tax=Dendrobium chrysotoxum TaxID=161865 RepID=A0AAV7HFC9_DENCH|nr:hypothetical protein IEQ34_002625 [Dendrobium chrysotoxum]